MFEATPRVHSTVLLPLRPNEARIIGKQNTHFAPIFVCKQNGFLRKSAGTYMDRQKIPRTRDGRR